MLVGPMPELPDLTVYVEHIARRVTGATLDKVRLASPFLVRTVEPPMRAVEGAKVRSVSRMAKRIVIGLEPDLFLVVHLMIAGRFRWKERGAAIPKKVGLAAFDFSTGALLLTEASTKKRASVHLVRGDAALATLDPGGVEPLLASLEAFKSALQRENHTLKRSLTDPRLFSGIGNAYSDEILHRAKLSPVRLTSQLSDAEIARLRDATREVLPEWVERLRADAGDEFPEKVTAFRDEMAVHGKYGKPCPACGAPVMRIRYAENEANYCAKCQTSGKLLADRGLSRLLGKDWPKSIEELEARKRGEK
jgi:formamidopyrimidine-DNA glycosylase